MTAPFPGLHESDRLAIALIARHHRKRHPDPNRDTLFSSLLPAEQQRVRWLAGILRIADGLDRTHAADIDMVTSRWTPTHLTITASGPTDPAIAIDGANMKKGLLEEIAGRTVTIAPDEPDPRKDATP